LDEQGKSFAALRDKNRCDWHDNCWPTDLSTVEFAVQNIMDEATVIGHYEFRTELAGTRGVGAAKK
jgi:hypothetical protein